MPSDRIILALPVAESGKSQIIGRETIAIRVANWVNVYVQGPMIQKSMHANCATIMQLAQVGVIGPDFGR